MNAVFDHAAAPRAIRPAKQQHAQTSPAFPSNITADPRVVRGSTFSLNRKKALTVYSQTKREGEPTIKYRKTKSRSWNEKSVFDFRPPTNQKNDLDLSSFLVERPQAVAMTAVESQTDAFKPKPEDPPYIPTKTGVDMSTQMTAGDQPFVFDREVKPLLEVIVGKTLEQALSEVEQEYELRSIAEHLQELTIAQAEAAAEVHALEAASVKEFTDMEARKESERTRVKRHDQVRHKVASSRLMKQVWPELKNGTFEWFEARGAWGTPITHTIRQQFMPWLYDQVDDAITKEFSAKSIVDNMLEDALKAQAAVEEAHRIARVEQMRLQKEEEAKAFEKARGSIQIFIQAESVDLQPDQVIGPIEVRGDLSVAEVELRVLAWLKEHDIVEADDYDKGKLHLALEGRELDPQRSLVDERVGDNAKIAVLGNK